MFLAQQFANGEVQAIIFRVELRNPSMILQGRPLKTVFSLLVLFLLAFTPAFAQSGRASLSGRVLDSSDNVLQGAEIIISPSGVRAATNSQGQFFVNNLDAGTSTVTVSYVGFEVFTKDIELEAGKTQSVEAKLKLSSLKTEVLVTAERAAGEAEAINRERSADNVIQVLPADVIRSLPNANLADALGRLPSVTLERDEGEGKYVQVRGTEPRLTNTTIDGINVPSPESGVRQVKFDAIPADIVESVEINKTLQANMDADGIGGSINLVTKTASERPTISVSGMGGYMPILGGRSQVETTATVGQRFGHDKKFGILIGGSYDWTGRGIDDIEPVSDLATFPGGAPQLWKDSIDVREYRYYRSRWGLAGSADYKLGEGSDIYARALYSNFKNYGDRWVYSLNDNTPGVQLLGSNGCDPDTGECTGVPSFNTQDRRPNIGIGSLLIGGKHELTSSWFAWDVSGSRSYLENALPGTASFGSTLSASNCQFDPATTKSIYQPQFTPACFSEAYDPTTMQLGDVQIDHGQSAQVNFQATGAAAKRYHLWGKSSTIEIGGRFRNAHKYDNSYNIDYTANDTILLSQFPNGFTNNNYYDGSYKFGYNVNYQTVRDFLMANLGSFSAASTAGFDPGNYTFIEKVSAGYLMDTMDISSRVRLVAGVRFEGTNLSVRNLFFDGTSGNPPTSNSFSGSYVKVLPSVSLRYAFTPNTNLRLVYGRGLSRPDPQDIAQAVTFTTVGSPGNLKNQVSLGNPNLKPETADNFDVLVEHYLNPFGMISAGYFYKRLSDPIVTQTFILTNFQPAPNIPPGTFTATQPINAGSAWISGFEAAYLQHLSFLPGPLSGLGISANYGYTSSSAKGLPGRSDHPRLLRNAPNTWNISPTYDRGRFSIRVGLSYNQANITAYAYQDGTATEDGTPSDPTPGGLKGPFSDQYFYSHLQVDAQGSVRLSHGLSFIAYGLNLSNEVFGFYQGSTQFMIQREYYKPTYAMGFRWNPTLEKR
jgi:TonB-dependent receptor